MHFLTALVAGVLLPALTVAQFGCREEVYEDKLPKTELEIRAVMSDPSNFPLRLYMADDKAEAWHLSCYTMDTDLHLHYYNSETSAYETTGGPTKVEYRDGTLWYEYRFPTDVVSTGNGEKDVRMHIAAIENNFILMETCVSTWFLTYDQFALWVTNNTSPQTYDIDCVRDALLDEYNIWEMVPKGICQDS